MAFSVKILRDSTAASGVRLTTMEVTMPRFLLPEFNTHRMFSRNSASSRAIPVEKKIAAIESDPFIPLSFGKNQKGMQASENLDDDSAQRAKVIWESAMYSAIGHAKNLAFFGVHKQLANRIIEPFCWQTVICTATEWDNFYALRCHPDAQPEIKKISEMMREAHQLSTPLKLNIGEWHLPLVDDFLQLTKEGYSAEQICMISAGRCARVSYLTHDGKRDPSADLTLANRLQESGHMSPFEHVATPMKAAKYRKDVTEEFSGNFRGWEQLRKNFASESDFSKKKESLCLNLQTFL